VRITPTHKQNPKAPKGGDLQENRSMSAAFCSPIIYSLSFVIRYRSLAIASFLDSKINALKKSKLNNII
jgi:hypothetical protein